MSVDVLHSSRFEAIPDLGEAQDYYDEIIARPDHKLSHTWLSQAEVDLFDHNTASNPHIKYVSLSGTSRITMPGWAPGGTPIPDKLGTFDQIFIPLNITGGRLMLIWDTKFHADWANGISKTTGHKWMHFDDGAPGGSIATFRYYADSLTDIAISQIRPQATPVGISGPPGAAWFLDCLKTINEGTGSEFRIKVDKWTRWWLDLDYETNVGNTTVNIHIADEDREAVQLYSNMQFDNSTVPSGVQKGLTGFRYEYDVSQEYRGKPTVYDSLPDMNADIRFFIALHDFDGTIEKRKPVA